MCGGFFLPVGAVKALVVQDFAVFALRDGVALFGGGFQVFFGGDVVVARAVKAGELVSVARGVRVGGVAVFASQAQRVPGGAVVFKARRGFCAGCARRVAGVQRVGNAVALGGVAVFGVGELGGKEEGEEERGFHWGSFWGFTYTLSAQVYVVLGFGFAQHLDDAVGERFARGGVFGVARAADEFVEEGVQRDGGNAGGDKE